MQPFSQSFKVLLLLAVFIASCSALALNNSSAEDSDNNDYGSGELDNAPRQIGNDTGILAYAGHNETCSSTGLQCEVVQNMECSANDGTGRCRCKSGWVYVGQTDTCWKVINSNQEECAHDVQCHGGTMGNHSRCSKHSKRCECFDYSTNGKREVVPVEGVCYIKKILGSHCHRDQDDCSKTIRGGGAYCKLGNDSHGACDCQEGHFYMTSLNACLKLATKLNDPCKISEQCTNGTLGSHSRCNAEREVCECYSPHEGTQTVYYEKLSKCFEKKEFNQSCHETDECRASLGADVECGSVDENNDARVCYCPEGKTCKSSPNGAVSNLILSSSYGVSFAYVVIIISSFVNVMGKFKVE